MIICYTAPEIWFVADVIFFFSFCAIFCPLTPPTVWKILKNLEKMKEVPGDIIIVHLCTTNNNNMMHGFWDMVHNRQMGRWKNWHTKVGAPPKNYNGVNDHK